MSNSHEVPISAKTYIDVAKYHLEHGLVEDAFKALKAGLVSAQENDRPMATAMMCKTILDTATKIHDTETKAKAETADKTLNVNMMWAQPKREIE